MSDDGDGIVSDIVGAVAGELKKFGQSATSQVTGSSGSNDLAKAAKSAAHTSPQSSSDDSQSIFGELKKFGQSATSQVTGGTPAISEKDVKAMVKKDDAFSKKESAAVAAKINRIYEEYAAKKEREKQQVETVEKQKVQVKEEQKKEIKKEETNAAIQKTRPEIKNYGAE